jgi:cobalamin biosynthesis protein CobT
VRANSLESALEKVSRIITDQYGLKLICEGNRCRTNGRTIYLPSLPQDVPDELLGAIRGWADHECAHAIYTRTRLGPEFKKEHGAEAFAILNALEDARVERLMARRFPGAKLNLEDGFRFVGDRVSEGEMEARSAYDQFTAALYTRASERPDQNWISADSYALADTCEDELSRMKSCRRTGDVARVALSIWEKVRDLFEGDGSPTDPEPAPPGPQSPQRNGQGPELSPEGAAKPPPRAPDQSSGPPAPRPVLPKGLSPMELLGSMVESRLEGLSSGEGGAYRVYTTQNDVVEVPGAEGDFDYHEEIAELRPYVAGLRRRLLQTLMGQRETLWLRDKARGRLDPRSLHRLVTRTSGRIFRTRTETKGRNTACTLLLDISSSMSGQSIDVCKQVALVFAETLSVLGFPTEIIGFSTLDDDLRGRVAQDTGVSEEDLAKRFARFVPTYHALYKSFEEPWTQVAARIGAMGTRSLTPLGESLLFAGRRLYCRPESRKVLFCLTDGKPVVGAWDEQVTFDHACQAVQQLSHAGIEPVGIGILEGCVRDIFPRHAVIHRLEELPGAFLAELCRVLSK